MNNNVVRFPTPIRIHQIMAEEHSKNEMRQHLGAAVGILHKPTLSMDDMAQILTHMTAVAEHINCMAGIKAACE